MKTFKNTLLLGTAMLMLILSSCKPTKEEALKYNDAIIDQQIAVMDEINRLDDALYSYDGAKMDIAFKKLDTQLKTSMEKVQKMEDLGGKSDFKDAAIVYFKQIQEGMVAELVPAMNQFRKPADEATEEDDDKADALYDKFLERLRKAFDPFVAAQNKQAKEYGYEIEKSSK